MSRLVAFILKLLVISVVVFVGVSTFYKVVVFKLNEQWVKPPAKVITKIVKARQISRPSDTGTHMEGEKEISAVSKDSHKRAEKEEIELPHPALDKLALRGTANSGQDNALAVIEDREIRSQGLYR